MSRAGTPRSPASAATSSQMSARRSGRTSSGLLHWAFGLRDWSVLPKLDLCFCDPKGVNVMGGWLVASFHLQFMWGLHPP